MELSFRDMENACERHFQTLGQTYHVCSPENFELIFSCREDFIAGMGILGICAKLFPTIRIYTFALMNNHFHIVMSGDMYLILEFIKLFKRRLQKYFEWKDRFIPFAKMDVKILNVESVDYFRYVVAYNNRNGFIVRDDCSPHSYPWGANACYFNKVLKDYYEKCREYLTVSTIRSWFHSKSADHVKGLFSLDGCVSSLSFCDIEAAEKCFRNEKQYFYLISKNVEAMAQIAKDIGETIFATDEDIFQIVSAKTKELTGSRNPALLPPDEKMKLARLVHFDYHASKKQINRILKIEMAVLDSMF